MPEQLCAQGIHEAPRVARTTQRIVRYLVRVAAVIHRASPVARTTLHKAHHKVRVTAYPRQRERERRVSARVIHRRARSRHARDRRVSRAERRANIALRENHC
ncbi:hypothetical protein NDU88_004048 [Pleurodeles waltl]|uniref:Uncharacterized protein n=1 Tax=Pleurodeles waltl TaxID=8319 RepID=A0AAV7PCV8_PLEWA|nr:hypothetical protein NDU88_004048 [Pleurodeles waltl]